MSGGHACSATLLNGMKVKDAEGDRRKMLSLDQCLVERTNPPTRFPSLHLGAGAPISWTRAGIPVPSMANPEQAFQTLFVEDNSKEKNRRRQALSDNASILDAVRENANLLNRQLASQDRQKLNEYLTSVREVERKLKRRKSWIDVPKPKAKAPSSDDGEGKGYPYSISIFYDLITLALQTDSSRVIVYQMPGGNRLFPFSGVTTGYHSLTHHGKRPGLLSQLSIIEAFYAKQFARFLAKLKKTRDTHGQPLLDSTTVLFGSGMGNSSAHSSRNLPILVAGGGMKHGSHHELGTRHGKDGTPLSNLFVTFLQQMDIETDRFASSSGDLNHLLT